MFALGTPKAAVRLSSSSPPGGRTNKEVRIGEVYSVKPARERSGGEITSENDDMSSDKECERHSRRKSKGSCLKLI